MADAIKPRRVFWTRMLRVALLIFALGWFGRFAYVRITTPPADPDRLFAELLEDLGPPPPDNAWPELAAALAAIPPPPPFNEPAPEGMQWDFPFFNHDTVVVADMCCGEWDLASRPNLRAAAVHVNSTPVANVLDRIRSLRARSWRVWPADAEEEYDLFIRLRVATSLFLGRARYLIAALGDAAGAWDDLKTALELSRRARVPATLVFHRADLNEFPILAEVMHMCREVALSDELAKDIELTLNDLSRTAEHVTEVINGQETSCLYMLRSCYSDDGRRNGWPVLSNGPGRGAWGALPGARCRLWNLASVVFDDRRTVEAKVVGHFQRIRALSQMSWPQQLAALVAPETCALPNLVAGPHVLWINRALDENCFHLCLSFVRLSAARRAARIMVALNRHRAEHGCYPRALDELAPGFLARLPVDPFCEGSFHYRWANDPGAADDSAATPQSYLLYSCGEKGLNDQAGHAFMRHLGTPLSELGDLNYTAPREQPRFDPRLESVEPAATEESNKGDAGDTH